MARLNLTYSQFSNGVPYLKFGTGSRTLLFLLGGPGNTLPVGAATAGFTRGMRGFCDEYTVYLVSRRSGLPPHYTTKDMADDYATIVRNDFGGHVDVIIGFSFGGLILQHFAADHGQLAGHMVMGGAAHKISAEAKRIDYQYALLVNQGKDREAMAERGAAVFPPGVRRKLLASVLWVLGPMLMGPVEGTFRQDVLIEAEAEMSHDAELSLGRIEAPLLVVCGRDDFAFSVMDVKETVGKIHDARLKVYNQGHSTVFLDKHFVDDVRAFTGRE